MIFSRKTGKVGIFFEWVTISGIIFKWIFYLSLNDEFDIKKKTMKRNCESMLSVY